MKLKKFVEQNYPSIQAFVDALSKRARKKLPHETVRHYVHGTRNPKPRLAKTIVAMTNQQVRLEDLYQPAVRQ